MPLLELPKQIYRFACGAPTPRNVLQLPYRIILVSNDQRGETWFIEDKNDFTTMRTMCINATTDPEVHDYLYEQNPT